MLHQSHARRLCRMAFIASCVVPTLAVLAAAVWWNLPSTTAQHLSRLEQLLDVRISAQNTSTPKPRQLRYKAVKLVSLDSDAPAVAVDQIDARRTNRRLELLLDGLTCDTTADVWLYGLVDRLLSADWPAELAIEARSANIADVLVDRLRIELRDAQEAGKSSTRRVDLLVETTQGPTTLTITRDRSTDGNTKLELTTAGWPLTGDQLARLVSPLAGLTQSARFAGTVRLDIRNNETIGSLAGTLTEITPLSLFDGGFTASKVELEFDQLQFTDGRIDVAQGTIRSEEGHIDTLALDQMARWLHLQGVTHPVDAPLDFDQLGCRFLIDGTGITLWGGTLASQEDGAIALRASQAVLLQPRYSQLPVAHVAHLFTAPDTAQIPATQGAVALVRRLPVPNDKQPAQ